MLNEKKIASLKPGRYRDDDRNAPTGLHVEVRPDGSSWVMRFTSPVTGKERWAGLGPVRNVGLAEARRLARAAHALIREGIDPIEQRREARREAVVKAAVPKSKSFWEVAEAFYNAKADGWKNKKQRRTFLNPLRTYAKPVIGRLPVSAVDTPHLLEILEPIWKSKPTVGRCVRQRIDSILDYARAAGYRSGDNPAKIVTALLSKGTRSKHFEAMRYDEVGAFLVELGKEEYVTNRALAFTILTAARSHMVTSARWDEVDLEQRVWKLSPERMKMNEEFRAPLSTAAVEILRKLPREANNPYLFVGRRKGTSIAEGALLDVMQRLGRKETVHGMRSSFRDWASERTSYPPDLIEMSLAHEVGSDTERAYARSDLLERRRRLMEQWAEFLLAPPASGETASVIPITGRR